MPPPKIKVTGKQVQDLKAGKDIIVTYLGKQYLVSPWAAYYAFEQFTSGHDVFVLVPTWVDGHLGPMEELLISA